MLRAAITLTAIGLAGACRPASLPDPFIDGVEPNFAWNGADETVSILGANFYPRIEVDAPRSVVDIDASFEAWLVGPDGAQVRTPFSGVTAVDEGELQATVGDGLVPGLYGVEVRGPTGRIGARDEVFTITDSIAAQLILTSDGADVSVTESVVLDLSLVDLAQEVVAQPFDVSLLVSGDGSVPQPTWGFGTLRNATLGPDGDVLFGTLVNGRATVELTVAEPETVTISLLAVGESNVVGDSIVTTFEPGSDLRLQIDLPEGYLGTTGAPLPQFLAGETFQITATLVDQFGNTVDTATNVNMQTSCSGWVGTEIEIRGPTLIGVTPVFATGSVCLSDQVGVANMVGLEGLSSPYEVLPGAVDHFRVTAEPPLSEAGGIINVLIDPEDAFGNRTAWSGVLTLSGSLGGFQDASCQVFGVVQTCVATVTVAGPAQFITADGNDGIMGTSNLFAVVAAIDPADIEVEALGTPAAGEPSVVQVVAYDPYGNPIEASALGSAAYTFTDELGEVSCTHDGFASTVSLWLCTFETARGAAVLTAEAVATGAAGDSTPFQVVNGALAVVEFSGEQALVAGELLTLTLDGVDAYGNPYVVQSDPFVDLTDDTHTWTEATAMLGASGSATVMGTLTEAGTTSVRALQAGTEIGVSDAIEVTAGSTSGLAVSMDLPWAWIDAPAHVTVEAVDAFGNRTAYGGTATLVSRNTGSSSVDVTLVNGVGFETYTWTSVQLNDYLDAASSDPFFGSSGELAVVEDCGLSNPIAALDFGGLDEALACVDPNSGTAEITGDMSGSIPAGPALARYALAADSGPRGLEQTDLVTIDLLSEGQHALVGLVADINACADEVEAMAWVGPDDGTPTGSILLSSSVPNLSVFDLETIDITGVVDCSRDPASFQVLRLRTTRGGLVGLTPSGEGLEVLLDVNGDGSVSLETLGGLEDGAAEVHAWSSGRTAGGFLSLPIIGDNVRPTVVAQSPTGLDLGSTPIVTLEFSEPLLEGTVVPTNFDVAGPGAAVVDTAALQPSGTTVDLTLTGTADGSLGAWSVVASSTVRDQAGNFLSGDWSGAATDYVGAFGDVGGTVDALTCPTLTPSSATLRPDGDDGSDSESDMASIEVESAQAPAWWVLQVFDTSGVQVLQRYEVPAGANDTLEWDGRDRAGGVVDNGVWEVTVHPEDGLGNVGVGCSFDITVDTVDGRSP